jgi:hypothetical protein
MLQSHLAAQRQVIEHKARDGEQQKQDWKDRKQEIIGQDAGKIKDPIIADLYPEAGQWAQPMSHRFRYHATMPPPAWSLTRPRCVRNLLVYGYIIHQKVSFTTHRLLLASASAHQLQSCVRSARDRRTSTDRGVISYQAAIGYQHVPVVDQPYVAYSEHSNHCLVAQ